jgi:hypothetical protein
MNHYPRRLSYPETLPRLTGARAWSLSARVALTWQERMWPDCLDVTDWRKHRAMAEGRTVERTDTL